MDRKQKGAASKAAPPSERRGGYRLSHYRLVRRIPEDYRYTITPQGKAALDQVQKPGKDVKGEG